MTAPSPLHRDPNSDDQDYGCFTARANQRVARVVARTRTLIVSGQLTTGESVVDYVRGRLRKIPSATDTIVKENVFHALAADMNAADLYFDWLTIYGW